MSTYKGIVSNGVIKVYSNISHLDGKEMEVELTAWRMTRSAQQNRYLQGVVYECVREAILETQGHPITKEQAAAFCKRSFHGVDRIAGIEVPRSTRGMDTVEFSDYIKRISHWCWSFANIVVPPPEYREE